MVRRIGKHFQGNVVAYVALFVALGGSAYAVTALDRDSVRSKHINNGAVKSKDVSPRQIQLRIRESCADDSAIRSIGRQGGVTCAQDDVGASRISFSAQIDSNEEEQFLSHHGLVVSCDRTTFGSVGALEVRTTVPDSKVALTDAQGGEVKTTADVDFDPGNFEEGMTFDSNGPFRGQAQIVYRNGANGRTMTAEVGYEEQTPFDASQPATCAVWGAVTG